jgi:hypothetical protein
LVGVVITAIVGFTSFTEKEKDEATNIGIKPYSWDEFLHMVGTILYGYYLLFQEFSIYFSD